METPWNFPAQRNGNTGHFRALLLCMQAISLSSRNDICNGSDTITASVVRARDIKPHYFTVIGDSGGFGFHDPLTKTYYVTSDYLISINETLYDSTSDAYKISLYNTFNQVLGPRFVFNPKTFTINQK